MIYFVDGKYTDADGFKLSIDDRGYYFGDGVYEVVKVYGGELFTAGEHFTRLFESAEKIKIDLPYTKEQLIEVAERLVRDNQIDTGHIYIQATRGSAPRVHQFPASDVSPVITAYAIENPRPLKNIEQGISVKIVDDMRWLRCDIKSLNLLGNVLAKQEAFEAGCAEALFVRDGIVMEGSSSNFFGIKDGIVYTHPATNLILNGITRRVVLELCEELGIQAVETWFTPIEALAMDECFITSTTAEVTPVISINDHKIGEGKPGELTRKLQDAFSRRIPEPASE